MKVVCAWCKILMREYPEHPDMISHGICSQCADIEMEAYQTRKKKLDITTGRDTIDDEEDDTCRST